MLADWALIFAEPPVVSAEALDELTAMLQPLRLTIGVPLAVSALLALGSSARTQALPGLPGIATARARTVTCWDESSIAEKRSCCGCPTITSTALALPVKLPVVGG